MKQTRLKTARLTLRPPRPSDQAFFIHLYGNPEVMKHIPPHCRPCTRGEAMERLETLISHWEERGHGMFVLEEEGTPVGYCGLRYLVEADSLELGYVIDQPHWGRGIAPEAAGECIRFAREILGVDALVSLTNPDNLGSRHILKKLGFIRCEAMDGIYHGMAHSFFVLDFQRNKTDRSE